MYSEYEIEIREKKIIAQRFLIDTLKAVNDKLTKRIKELEAVIERQKETIRSQGEACEERHNFLCRLKEIADDYFEQALKAK